jgi:hypothetical protein
MLGASRLPGGAPAGSVGQGGARLVQPQPLMGAIGGPHPGGIQVYHSSPFDFTNFDMSKLRTGQGANTKGAGFYFAEHPEVSGRGGEYWQEFTRKFFADQPELGAASYLEKHNFDRDAAIRDVQNQLDAREFYAANPLSGSKPYDPAQQAADLAYLNQLTSHLRGDAPVGARTYEVNIEAQPQQLLNLDKPLSEQPTIYNRIDPKVRNAIDDMLDERGVNAMSDVPEAYTGRDLYKSLTHHDVQEVLPAELPESSWYTGHTTEDKHASAYLRSLDIPGMQFLDQASRNAQRALAASKNPQDLLAPKPTYNYVGVDPTKLNIYAKYALPGAIGAGPLWGSLFPQREEQ